MEHLALGLVLLAGTLTASSPPHRQAHTTVTELPMDMALASFDDRYRGCGRLMEQELAELNRTEFASNDIYAKAWSEATKQWQSQQGRVPRPRALRPELAVALLAYSMHDGLYHRFNEAVRRAGRSRREYLGTFHFKALHFLLTEAVRVLRDTRSPRCHHVYRGIESVRFTARLRQAVRFGQFTSTSSREEEAKKFGEDTFFWVETCYGVPIGDFSYYANEEEVLIPPFETFEVTNITRKGSGAFIQLRSQGTHSTYNCELVKETHCKYQPCAFDAARSILRDAPHLWGLLLAAMALAATRDP
ncbi:NARE ribosyltransferase, partial [Podargus strigoides]|nr:NARE ribosyltransferase [Podargus strigoides]